MVFTVHVINGRKRRMPVRAARRQVMEQKIQAEFILSDTGPSRSYRGTLFARGVRQRSRVDGSPDRRLCDDVVRSYFQ